MKTELLNIFKKSSKSLTPDGWKFGPESTHGSSEIGNIDDSLINETVSDWLSPKASTSNLDRVLTVSIEENVISPQDVTTWTEMMKKSNLTSSTGQLTWRDVVRIDPRRSQQFERMAARIYGFRSILICQMSTLVLADMMTVRVLPEKWEEMYDLGLAPVVEHGHSPLDGNRVVCISKDPTSRKTRDYVNGITSFQPELAYADGPVVAGMLEMISQHVPAIGSAVYVSRPYLQKVASTTIPNKRAA
ncbi:MAG: hypothetical protein O3B41_04635 [Bacteroidetes bacterium]|nr:hypothetical protein [Bacteroidota bacterium]